MTAHVPAAKPYKGLGMEGGIAKWYAKLTCTALEDSKKDVRRVAEMIPPGSKVLDRSPQSALRCCLWRIVISPIIP